MPFVSAIIPTVGRQDLVVRAVKSVFAQTFGDLELIVVVDGQDPETVAALKSLSDRRLRVIVVDVPEGPGPARNKGVEVANGQWIAFLDDDDQWLPTKLERQLAVALAAKDNVVVTCLSYVATPVAQYIWPRSIYDNRIPFDEYLFDRRSLFLGEAFVPTPSLLMSRNLFNEFKFSSIRIHEDWDLLLRLMKICEARLITVEEPLVTIHYEEGRSSLSDSSTWISSMNWIGGLGSLISRRAYSGFCLTVAGPEAAKASDRSAFFVLLYRAFKDGSPTPLQLIFFLIAWIIPINFRRRLRSIRYRRTNCSVQ
jgi:glycosyltransferase involved in cell wall biosynthesis